ncbi:hypothetical protein [Streptomyces caniscabiei]|nr:hypothetical protein [Streptomyces caniscabiei]MDX3725220.1 hypothetical protein [Streptomyces caniscabiei]WEO21697.1 hypothetical protein IHE65_00240 [Streptomyces caniscabiei]
MSRELDPASGELDRTCPECQTGFRVDSVTSRRKYCSPTCREKARSHLPTQRTCPQCEREFTTTLSPKRMFCSDECRTAAREAQTETRTCPACENSFEARRTVRTRYCSAVCRREAEHRRDRARRLGQAPPALPARIELPPPPPVRTASRQSAAVRDPLEPTATRNCPHCQQPVTIVALLATPEAARPTMPHHRTDVVPLRRTP